MSTVEQQTANQIANIEKATGRTFAEWVALIQGSGLEPGRLEDLQNWIQLYRRMVEQRIDRFGDLIDRTKGDSR